MIRTFVMTPLALLEAGLTIGAGLCANVRCIAFQKYDYREWLRRDLADCDSILELGCGSNSPILQIGYGQKTTALDIFPAYVRMHNAANHYAHCWIGNLLWENFGTKRYDAVVICDVLEHLDRPSVETTRLFERIELAARKKVILFTPNGWTENSWVDGNEYQLHRSVWGPDDYQKRGYTVTGTHGWRWIIGEAGLPRRRPYSLWSIVAMLSLPLMVKHPEWAGHSYAVKEV